VEEEEEKRHGVPSALQEMAAEGEEEENRDRVSVRDSYDERDQALKLEHSSPNAQK
jgi:hypothetical protein